MVRCIPPLQKPSTSQLVQGSSIPLMKKLFKILSLPSCSQESLPLKIVTKAPVLRDAIIVLLWVHVAMWVFCSFAWMTVGCAIEKSRDASVNKSNSPVYSEIHLSNRKCAELCIFRFLTCQM